jgi:hypothetical protein
VSTRTRIIMTYKGQYYSHGRGAIRELLQRVYPDRFTGKQMLQAVGLRGLSKRLKIEKLAEKLPLDFAIIMIQEPRHTRKSRSIYWAYKDTDSIKKEGL